MSKRIAFSLIFISVLLTPFFGIFEFIELFSSKAVSLTNIKTPFAIKILKDVIFIFSFLLIFHGAIMEKTFPKLPISYCCCLLFVMAWSLFFFVKQPLLSIIGIRACLPFLGFAIGSQYSDLHMRKLSKAIFFIFLVELIGQCVQLFLINQFGKSDFGISLRNPGTFLVPSTMAYYAVTCFSFYFLFLYKTRIKMLVVFFLSSLSVLLTTSATGMLVIFLLFFYILTTMIKQKSFVYFFSFLLVFFFIFSMTYFTGRDNLWDSLSERINIVSDIKASDLVFGTGFGSATNAGVLLDNIVDDSFDRKIADSTFAFLLFNFGLIGCIPFIIFFFFQIKNNLYLNIPFWISLSCFSLTVIIFETYPMNWLNFIMMGYLSTLTNPESKNA